MAHYGVPLSEIRPVIGRTSYLWLVALTGLTHRINGTDTLNIEHWAFFVTNACIFTHTEMSPWAVKGYKSTYTRRPYPLSSKGWTFFWLRCFPIMARNRWIENPLEIRNSTSPQQVLNSSPTAERRWVPWL